METICQPYNNPSIYKVIWRHTNNDEHKYIFIGIRTKEITNILTKLEELGKYDMLSKSQQKQLEKEIPNFQKLIGKIEKNRFQFIYSLLDDLDNIQHAMEDISYAISTTNTIYNDENTYNLRNQPDKLKEQMRKYLIPSSMYIWGYFKTITYKYLVNVVNYLFAYCKTTSKKNFTKMIMSITAMTME